MESTTQAVEGEEEALQPQSVMYAREKDFTDTGNANCLRELVGTSLRYVTDRKQWLIWRNGRWSIDEHEVFVREQALRVAKYYLDNAKVLRANGNEHLGGKYEKW